MSSLEPGDRRRLLAAGVTTIAVLPFLFGGGSAPNTGVAAIGEGANLASALDSSAAAVEAVAADVLQPTAMPGFLLGPPPATDPSEVRIVVPTSGPRNLLEGTATYDRFTDEPGIPDPCAFPGVAYGTDLLVLDLDNGKSIWCSVVAPPAAGARAHLVLDTEEFEEIADLGESPIHVRITW